MYVLHFAVLEAVSAVLRSVWKLPVAGISSVLYLGVLFALAVVLSFWLSSLSYRFIEKPFIRFGKSLTSARPKVAT